MKIGQTLISVLNIKPGESKPIGLLMGFSFFMGAAIAFFYTAATTLLLAGFETTILPWVYIASGIIGYIVWYFSSHMEKRYSFSSLMKIYLGFLAISVLIFAIALNIFNTPWISFLMFIWIRVFTFITAVVFWGVAAKLFNLRQGKRLFGLISSGEVLSNIIGFLSIPVLMRFIITPTLVIIAFISLVFCLIFLLLIIKGFKDKLQEQEDVTQRKAKKIAEPKIKYNNYFKLLFLMAVLPMFSIYFIDYIFLYQTKSEFADKEVLASFLGLFLGFVAIAELLIKTFASGRLISKYGLKLGLSALPVMMFFSTFLASLSGTVYGITAMFFSFVLLSKLFERAIRSSINDPSFQILYQPLPHNERLFYQSRIEGIPKAIGNTIAGIVLLVMTSINGINLVHFNYVFLVILGYWIWLSFKQFKAYRNTLQNVIEKEKTSDFISEGSENINNLKDVILNAPSNYFHPAYNLIERSEPAMTSEVPGYILKNSQEKIKDILFEIRRNNIIEASDIIDEILEQDDYIDDRDEFVKTAEALKEVENTRFEELAELSRSPDPDKRIFAVKLLARSGRYNTFRLLMDLLQDKNILVRKAALIASGKINRHELWTLIIDNLLHPQFTNEAFTAIEEIGKPVLQELDLFFGKLSEHKETQIRIIKLYQKIGGAEAIDLLKNKINHHDKEIRYQVLLALSKLEYQAKTNEGPSIKQSISEEIAIIIWLLATINEIGTTDEVNDLQSALKYELSKKKEDVFLLLSLIYDPKTIKHIRERIESKDNDSRVYALEIIDMTLSEDLKTLIIPILDDLTYKETISYYNYLFPQQKLSLPERLKDILNKDYSKINSWTKACALELIPKFPCTDPIQQYAANLINPNTILLEIAAYNLYNADIEKYLDIAVRLARKANGRLVEMTRLLQRNRIHRFSLLINKVRALKSVDLFLEIPEIELLNLASSASERILKAGEGLSYNINEQKLIVVADGKLSAKLNEKNLFFPGNAIIGEIIPDIYVNKKFDLSAQEETTILELDINILYSMMTDHPEISKKIMKYYFS